MQVRFFYTALIAFLISGFYPCFAQTDTTDIKRITLNDGSELTGIILSDSTDKIEFRTLTGLQIEIEKSMIKEVENIKGTFKNGEFVKDDPNNTRLLFAPTGRTLRQGEGYFSAYEIFFPFLAVGITDFITLSGGVSLFPGADEQIIYIAPKIRCVHINNFDFSAGVLYAHISEADFGILYGVGSIGSSDASLTLGLGYGYTDSELADKPVIMIGGEIQLSGSIKLLSENWIPPDADFVLLSFGVRFFGEHLAADFGLITTTESTEGFPFIPWLGFVYNF